MYIITRLRVDLPIECEHGSRHLLQNMNVPYIMSRVDDIINNTFFHELFEVPNNMSFI